MFSKRCIKCGGKIDRDFGYCPYCGYNLRKEKDKRDFGLLGKEDNEDFGLGVGMPFGFNRIFNSLLKQLDSQFRDLDKNIGKEAKYTKSTLKPEKISKGLSISIASGTGMKPEIKIRGFGPGFEGLVGELNPEEQVRQTQIKLPRKEISEYESKKISKLPKEEALTQVRRLSNKIVYEISLPGVKKIKDVIINQLENSIEIKAFSKDKVYFKLLPINLPILNYKLEDDSLVLELKPQKS